MPTSRVDRRLAAIVAADIVGYSRLMGDGEDTTLAALKAHRAELVDALIAGHHGHIVKTMGDGLLLEFPSVVEAVTCVVEMQRGMAERNRDCPPDRRLEFRIGVHVGDVIFEEGDVFGEGVNVAARLEQLAAAGGICLSEDAYRQVRGKLPLAIVDAGERRLKNIASPMRIYQVALRTHPDACALGREGRSGGRRRMAPRLAGTMAVAALVAVLGTGLWLASLPRQEEPAPQEEVEPAVEAPAARGAPILAVLPFVDQTGDEDQGYLADGLTEEIINALGRFHSLRVIGRNAVLPYKDRPPTREEIESELGASYLVEGSVRRADPRFRIAAQLTDAVTGTVRWAEHFEGEIADVFGFQEAIARHVAGTLAASIERIEVRRAVDQPRPDPDAYDLILQARAIGFTRSRSANRRYRELTAAAIELDPDYALAHALLAEAIYAQTNLGWTEFVTEEMRRGETLARRAIALAPDEPDGHRVLGSFLAMLGEYELARSELARAIEINPSDATALAVWGTVQAFDGAINDAIELLELALRYDPALDAVHLMYLSIAYHLGGRHDDAISIAERGLSRYPEFAALNVPAAAAAARLGRGEQATRYVESLRRRLPFLDPDGIGSRYRDPAHRDYLRDGLDLAGL